jgi:hypothetical protein
VKGYGDAFPRGNVQQGVDRVLEHGGQLHHDPDIHVVLHTGRDRGDKFFQGGPRGQHNLPGPEDVLGTGHEVARQKIIRRPLGEPVRQTGARGLIKGLPAQIGPNTVPVFRLSREPARDFLKEAQREPQLACEVIRDGDRRRNRLRQEPTVDP